MQYQNFSLRQILTLTWWNRPDLKHYDGILCDGSIRAGKTVSMADGFILWSMSRFNGQNFLICGRTIESLRRNVTNNLSEWLAGVVTITERRSENKLIVTCGNVTNNYYLFGGKDESSYQLVQGITAAGCLMDEVALMPRSFVEQVLGRCSVAGSKFWFNCNPENPGHWFFIEWVKKCKERNILHLHFTMNDNPGLDPEIKARYEAMFSGVFYRRYILGEWVRAEGLVYPMFDKSAHVITADKTPKPRHRYYVSVDYGTVNPFAAGLYDYDPAKRTATMIREFYWKGGSANRLDNEAYYQKLKELIGDFPIEYIVIDPSAAAMKETISKYGEYAVKSANNDVLNGIQDVTKYLNHGVLYFDKSCVETFKEFEAYSWDEEFDEDRVIKENDHSMDQLRYFCRTVLRADLYFTV